MKFKRWMAEDTERLIKMVDAGQSAARASAALNHTVFFIRTKVTEMVTRSRQSCRIEKN